MVSRPQDVMAWIAGRARDRLRRAEGEFCLTGDCRLKKSLQFHQNGKSGVQIPFKSSSPSPGPSFYECPQSQHPEDFVGPLFSHYVKR